MKTSSKTENDPKKRKMTSSSLKIFTCILEWGQGACKKSKPYPARAYTTLVVLVLSPYLFVESHLHFESSYFIIYKPKLVTSQTNETRIKSLYNLLKLALSLAQLCPILFKLLFPNTDL